MYRMVGLALHARVGVVLGHVHEGHHVVICIRQDAHDWRELMRWQLLQAVEAPRGEECTARSRARSRQGQ